MADQQKFRNLERKYRRLKRQDKMERFRANLPALAVTVLLTAAAVIAICFAVRQRHPEMPTALRMYVLDVGQGDAVLLTTETHSVLIDAGDPDQGMRIVQMLKALHIDRLDCVINSHPHADHIGGLADILSEMPVGAIYLPQMPETLIPTSYTFSHVLELAEEKGIALHTPACGEVLPLGTAELTFLSVDNSGFDGLNDCSLGCCITCGTQRFFCAGDLEAAGEKAFLAAGLIAPVTVLKVSHHGSSSSTTPEFISAAQPQFAAISCGARNDYGHPSEKALRTLRDAGCAVYRTDLDGTVIFATDGTSALSVELGYDFGFLEARS